METRKKVELAIAAVVIVAFVALLAWYLSRGSEPVIVDDGASQEQLDEPADRAAGADEVEPEDIPTNTAVSASTIGRTFVERFGSYSSESDYANVEDILSLATPSFQKTLNDIMEKARKNAGDAYYGISTLVITTKTVKESDTAVTLRMTTQREEAIDDPANATVRYQDIVVDLTKSGEDWLIAGFTWQ